MTRGLSNDQITILQKNAIIVENLLEIGISAGQQSAHLTTGPHDTVATTVTSNGPKTFLANNPWSGISQLPDKVYTTQNKIAIFFEGDMSIPLPGMTTAPINFRNNVAQFKLHKLFRNADTNAIESAVPIFVFEGRLAKITYTTGVNFERIQFDIITNNKPYAFLPLNTVPSFGAL